MRRESEGAPHPTRLTCSSERLRRLAVAVAQQGLLPALVDRAAGTPEAAGDANGLHRVVRPELPAQVLAGHEAAQAGVEGADVVVLQVDLDEGLPVVVALVQLDPVEGVAGEIKVGSRAHAGQVGGDVATVVLEQQAIPLAQLGECDYDLASASSYSWPTEQALESHSAK